MNADHVHEGATEQWSPAAELAAAGQSPELQAPTRDEASASDRAALDAIEERTCSMVAELVDRALDRLERAR